MMMLRLWFGVATAFAASASLAATPEPAARPTIAAAKIDAAQLRGWDAAAMRRNAARSPAYCTLGKWEDHWLGPEGSIALQREIAIVGEDLAMYKSVTDGVSTKLHRLAADAARTGDSAALKTLMLKIASERLFTAMKPYEPTMWEGKKPSWVKWYATNIPEAEPAFNAAILLTTASISYALIRDALKPEEEKAIRDWGNTVYSLIVNAKKDGLRTPQDRQKGSDRAAAYTAAFVAWGAATQNAEMFRLGVARFEERIAKIRSDGTESFFVRGIPDNVGIELKYQNFAYGLLVVAANVLRMNGIDAFAYRAKGGGSLADGLAFHFAATLDPKQRKRMGEKQDSGYIRSRGFGADTLAYAEFAANAGLMSAAESPLGQIIGRSSPLGFYSSYYGGYTTCLFGDTR